MFPTTSLVLLLSAILTALGDVQRPTQGHQIGFGPGSGYDIIFPLTITQCEPVVIYYNMTHSDNVYLATPHYDVLYLYFPRGVGYLDWICDIPTAYSFRVYAAYYHAYGQYYTVQPGSSSACLGDITTTYSYADYFTSFFQFYTQHFPSGNPFYSIENQQPTIDFPTSSFPTITANPNLAVIPTTARSISSPLSSPVTPTTTGSAASSALSSPVTPTTTGSTASSLLSSPVTPTTTGSAASSPLSSPVTPTTTGSTASSLLSNPVTPTTTGSAASSPLSSPSTASSVSSHKSNTPVIAGGVVGGIAFVLLTITIIFVGLWKRRNLFSDSLLKSTTPYLTSQLGSTSPPLLPSSDSTVAMCRRGKFTRRTPVPDTSRRNHDPTHKPRYPGANLASTLDVTRLTAGQRQVLMAALNASVNPTTPPATEPLEPSVHEAAQEEFPEMANVLGVISQLDPETRNALVTSLHNLLMVDQATPADLTTGNTPSLPPYAE